MNFNKILRYIVLAGVFAIPFIPFIVPGSMFFPFITGKNFTFRIAVEVMFASWIVLALLDRSYVPRRSAILIAATAFIGVVTLADVFGVNPYKSFWSNYERMEGLVSHLHFFAYFLMAGTVLSSERKWNAFWKTSLAASVIMSLYGLGQLGGMFAINQGGVRLDGTFGNAAYLAVYVLIHIFIALFFLVREWRNVGMRYFYLGVIALETVILYYTATRGALLGLIGGGFVAAGLIALFGKEYGNIRKAAVGALAALVVLVGGFFLVRDTAFVRESPVLSRFASISLTEKTTLSRFAVWNMAFQGFKERPVLGWGQENFNFVFNKYYDPKMYNQEQWFDRTHNIFLDWLIAGGALGFLSYISLFGAILYMLWRSRRFTVADKSIFAGLLAAYFIHNLFVFDNLVSYILFFSIAAYLHSQRTHEEEKGETRRGSVLSEELVTYGIAPVAALLLIAGAYYLNVRPMSANFALVDTIRYQNDPGQALESYKRVFGYRTFGSTEARERLLSMQSAFAAAPANIKAEYAELAKREMAEQLAQTPNDARHLLFYGSYLSQTGAHDEALAFLSRAIENSPRKQAILIETASVHLAKGDYPKALELLRRAYELEPANNDALVTYAIGAMYAKEDALAKKLFASVSEEARLNDNRLLSAYADLKMYDEVVKIWSSRLAKDPGNVQYRMSLAATYLQMGDRARAISELEAVKKANPQYTEQIDFYIKEIRAGKNPAQ